MKERVREEAKEERAHRGKEQGAMRTRRKWTAVLYYGAPIALTLFIPIAIIAGARARGVDIQYGWFAGILAFLILLSYLIFPSILGRRDE